MAQPKFNSNDVLQMLIDIANENGYSLIINGTKDDALQIAVYPFRGTIVSNEEIARLLYDVIEKNGVTEDSQTFTKFMQDVQPDDLNEWVFSNSELDGSKNETRISVFHNKNVLLKHIIMKL